MSPISRLFTVSMWMIWRVSVSTIGSSTPTRLTIRCRTVFGGPRISVTASFRLSPSTVLPFTAVIRSPGFNPAAAAGVPSIGLTT